MLDNLYAGTCSYARCAGRDHRLHPFQIADATREEATLGMRVSAAYTSLSRAEWALARVAGGEGALAGKYRHPAVAPYLRALQRQFAHVEALL